MTSATEVAAPVCGCHLLFGDHPRRVYFRIQDAPGKENLEANFQTAGQRETRQWWVGGKIQPMCLSSMLFHVFSHWKINLKAIPESSYLATWNTQCTQIIICHSDNDKGKGKREKGNRKWEMGNGKREKGNGKREKGKGILPSNFWQ